MTGKPREKLHLIHLRCQWCFQHHYNTHNQGTIVVTHGTYPDDPLLVLHIFHMSNIGGRYPFSLSTAAIEFNRLRRPTNQYYSQHSGRTFMAGGVYHGTMVAHIPSSIPSLEDISV